MTNQELLKIYSAYLPYGVEVLVDDGNGIYTDFITGIGVIDDMIFLDKTGDWYYNDVNDFTAKLILRPLSDLTKWIEHNGENFVPLDYLYSKSYPIDYFEYKYHHDYFFSWIESKDKSHHVKFLPHGLIKQLQEWHFDVFGLLDKNLAINLNEVK